MAEPFFSINDLGLSGSSSDQLNSWLATMQAFFPGYSPSASSLEFVQAQIMASLIADVATLCGSGATELFRTYGTELVGLPYQQGVSAEAVISVTADAAPPTIATTSGDLAAGTPIVSIPVVALAFGVAPGSITITDPTTINTQSYTTPGANAGDTSISISSAIPNFAYPTGSSIGGTQAYVVPVLSQFTLDSLGFVNLAEVDVLSGTSVTVLLTAVQAGILFNGAGSGGNLQSVQQLSWLGGLSLVTPASGGIDPEDDTHYLNRLKGAIQLQAPRPITATDYGSMALNFSPYPGTNQQEVGRATSVDGYNPATLTYGNPRMVAVAATDANGFALNNDTLYGFPAGSSSNIIKTTPSPNSGWGLAGWLESLREIDFIVNVINPTYTPIYVTVTVKGSSGWDAVSVQQNVQGSLLNYLSPPNWGLPPSGASWQNTTTIRPSRLTQVIQNTPGVDYVVTNSLAFGTAPAPANAADLLLPGPVALPTSSAATLPLAGIAVT